jgi:Protein kinase domain/Inner membrane component of T3SS, cytoplasmic domain
MAKQFVVIVGPDRGLVLEVGEAIRLPIGRSRQALLRLHDPQVSRSHCVVEVAADWVMLRDVGSTGGTFVNGQRVSEHVLRPGDVITLGKTQLQYQEEDLADQPTLPPEEVPAEPVAEPAAVVPEPAAAAAPEPPPRPARPARVEAVPGAKLAALPPERMSELSGQTLAHFRIGPLVARGQSGLVFQARDFKHHRDVALKVLHPQFTENKEGVNRFVRAMKTMLPLRHPNLVALYGAGKTGPYCWAAMEYVEGESLAQVIHRIGVAGMLDWRFTLRIAVDLARALQFAHQHQIIHRNITPQNTLLRERDKRALLGDLMLAKAMEGALAVHVTRAGEVVGDIRYMSPERLAGNQNVDARSDIYSLGALIYALLTGHAPFEGETTTHTISLIYKSDLIRPKKFQMSIADAFEGVVMTMLSRYPEKRFQTADKVVADLESVAKFQAVEI